MNNVLKAVLLPTLTKLAGKASASLAASNGAYAGVDVTAGQTFTGLQGRLGSPGAPTQFAPSVEGTPYGDTDRWQLNADVLRSFGAEDASLAPYAGAGVCVVGASGAGKTNIGLNLMGGTNVTLGPLDAFVQLRLTLADGFHLSLTGGALPA